jgi:hypothetical protein
MYSNGKCVLKIKINIGRRCLRQPPNIRQHLDPPYFSLPTTFKGK